MTGTDEHGAKIVEAAEAHGTSPLEWTDRTSARFVEAWKRLNISNDDFIRTTEPRHHAVVQEFSSSGSTTTASSSWRNTPACIAVSCEDYYTADQLLSMENAPCTGARRDRDAGGQFHFFRLSAPSNNGCSTITTPTSTSSVRRRSATKAAWDSMRGGLNEGGLHPSTSFRWGVASCLGTTGIVFYVWYGTLINYLTVASYGSDPGTVRLAVGERRITFDRQGHSEVPLLYGGLAMCMAASIDPPQEIFVHGLSAHGRSRSSAQTMIQSGVSRAG